MSAHLFLKTKTCFLLPQTFQREANDIHRLRVITWHVVLLSTVMSKALKGNIFYSRGSLTQMLTESPSALRWSVSHALFVYSHGMSCQFIHN